MLIPVPMRDFDEANPGLGKPPCHQALAAKILCGTIVDAVLF